MTRTALAPALVAVMLAGPAAAMTPFDRSILVRTPDLASLPTGFSHGFEGRFGAVATRDRATGRTRVEPVAAALLQMNWVVDTDAGWRVAFTFEIEASNLREHRHPAR